MSLPGLAVGTLGQPHLALGTLSNTQGLGLSSIVALPCKFWTNSCSAAGHNAGLGNAHQQVVEASFTEPYSVICQTNFVVKK